MEFNLSKFTVGFNCTRCNMFMNILIGLELLSFMKNKHMSNIDRITIENDFNARLSFKNIGKKIEKDCMTISKEIKNNIVSRDTAGYGRVFNNCLFRNDCLKTDEACDVCSISKVKKCHLCTNKCVNYCPDFVIESCPKLDKPPYVCNTCEEKNKCSLTNHFYYALQANKKYEKRLSESRQGMIIDEDQIDYLNHLLIPLVRNQNQSIHHIFINHVDEIMMSEKTLYKIIDLRILKIRNIDFPKKVRFRPRRKKSTTYVDKHCLDGRRYEDFELFIKEHPDVSIVEMNTVEGVKDESCLLTIHFVVSSFMIAIKREFNDSKSVTDFFDDIYHKLGKNLFMKLFPIILTNNGSEFSNPEAIEFDENGKEELMYSTAILLLQMKRDHVRLIMNF